MAYIKRLRERIDEPDESTSKTADQQGEEVDAAQKSFAQEVTTPRKASRGRAIHHYLGGPVQGAERSE